MARMRSWWNSATGAAGASRVTAEFEDLGWGVVPVPQQHDLGTDLLLMAVDARGFDLHAMMGAQVKAEKKWFRKKHVVDGEPGWWFSDNDKHFDYWAHHQLPHVIVLHRTEDRSSFWVHATPAGVDSTGRHNKIFVPEANKIDMGDLEKLIDVATSRSAAPAWEGSAWVRSEELLPHELLRYALIAPRVVAPHASSTPEAIRAVEAIALIMNMRTRDLERWRDRQPLLDPAHALNGDWEWRLFAGLRNWIIDGDLAHLRRCPDDADGDNARVAATVVLANALFERGEVREAAQILAAVLAEDDADPVNHAWLKAQMARCHAEVGELERAQELALEVMNATAREGRDPTARMLAGVAAHVVLNLELWQKPTTKRAEVKTSEELPQADSEDARLETQDTQSTAAVEDTRASSASRQEAFSSAVLLGDTHVTWWRSQQMMWGLAAQLEEDFRQWSRDSSRTFGAVDTTWRSLRAAMLQAGVASDQRGWRFAAGLLAQRQLMRTRSQNEIGTALALLIQAGDERRIELAVGRLLAIGSVDAVVEALEELRPGDVTYGSLGPVLTLIRCGGDVASEPAGDRLAAWILESLSRPDGMAAALRSRFAPEYDFVRSLASLVASCSHARRAGIRRHLCEIPPVTHPLTAMAYASVLSSVDRTEWSEDELSMLWERSDGDRLKAAIASLRSNRDSDYRGSLIDAIASGDLEALDTYGDVRDLPSHAVAGALAKVIGKIDEEIADAQSGQIALHSNNLRNIALLNLHHPEQARWESCLRAAEVLRDHRDALIGLYSLLGTMAEEVPDRVRQTLLEAVAYAATKPSQDTVDPFDDDLHARGVALYAYGRLYPERMGDAEIARLLRGDTDQRQAAVAILARRRHPGDLNVLFSLVDDGEGAIRAEVAHGLGTWQAHEVEFDGMDEILASAVADGGVGFARNLVEGLAESKGAWRLPVLWETLTAHPSAMVRRETTALRRNQP